MKDSTLKSNLSKIIGIMTWLILWQILSMMKNNPYIIPAPLDTLKALVVLLGNGKFLLSIFYTLLRVFGGFFISVLVGVVIGVASGLNHWVHDIMKPFVSVVRSTPVISVIIIIHLWVQSDYVPLVIAFLMCFPIIWTSSYEGIQNTDKNLLEMVRCFKLTKKSIIRNVYLPSVRPYVIAGITASLGIAWKVTVAAEVISFPDLGIGRRLYESKIWVETPEVFAWTLIIVILSLIFEYFIKKYLRRMVSDQ
jgi:NitT/TauT family transport system permease protein